MKKYLALPLIALLLLTTSLFISCSAKEQTSTSAIAETSPPPDQEMAEGSHAPEAELKEKPHSPDAELAEKPHPPEADAGDKSRSPEAELNEKPHSPEAGSVEKPHSPEADAGDKSRSPEAELAEKPHSPEAESVEKPHSPEAELAEKPHPPEADAGDKPRSPEAELAEKPHAPEAELTEKPHAPEEETHRETKPEETEIVPNLEIPEGSVLHLIPEQTLGLIYCPSLLELDYRINTLVTDLIPTDEPPEVLAQILANTFGAGFENLAELEEIGLDLDQDFAIFMATLDPPAISATVHLTDPEAMKQVIDAESEGSAPTEYNGVTYWSATGGDGHFAILENMLVFSQSAEVCESAIDAYKGAKQSVVANPDYSEFLTDIVEGDAQVALHFNLEPVAPPMIASLERESESMRDSMESDPAAMSVAPFFGSVFSTAIDFLEQSESLSATLEVKGTDVQLAPSLKFKNGSAIQQYLEKMIPDELAILNDLPNLAFVNGAYQLDQKLLIDLNTIWLKMFSAERPEQQEKLDALTQQITTFYESLGDELGFSVNFGESIIPDYMIVYTVKDKQQAQGYMENMFIEQMLNIMGVMRDVIGNSPGLTIYDGAHAGESLMHNDVEIKSYVFPNFGSVFEQVPPEAAGMFPQEWHWYYAFHEDQLFFATGSAEMIKAALDRKDVGANPSEESEETAESGVGDSLAENPSYQKLIETLGTDNNVFLALSPITAVKSIIPIVSDADPNAAAAMQMFAGMFMNMPESYSIGFSAKAEEDSISLNLLLTLGDFKQAIAMIMMMQGMGQM